MDGSIQERLNSKGKKVYDVSYRVFDPKTGKKKQKLKRGFLRKSDAQNFRNDVTNQIKTHTYVEPQKITVKELLEEWYKKFVNGKLAPNTVSGYKVNIFKHIIPNLGYIQLQMLTTRNIQNFYDDLLADLDDESSEGLSPKSIIYIHRNFSKALDYAVKEKYIFSNPAKDVELPSAEKYVGKVFNHPTIINLLHNIKDTEMEIPVALAGLSGLRRGEVAGLKWEDVDLESCILTVRKQRTAKNQGTKRSRVKTSDSYRCIRFSSMLLEILKRHKELQNNNKKLLGDEYKDNNFVCCESDGNVIDPRNFSKRFTRILKKYHLEQIRFHDLRHSFATNMIRIGVPINTVSAMLGHSNPTITLTIYAHVVEEMQQEAVQKLDEDIKKYLDKIDTLDDNLKEERELYLTA